MNTTETQKTKKRQSRPRPDSTPRLATRIRQTQTRRHSHFQFSIFNFQLLLVLALIAVACTDESPLEQPDPALPVNLNPGEQAVTLTVGGMTPNGTAKQDGTLSRADSPANIIETEGVVSTLHIYSFINLKQDGTDATLKDDYTLERVYKYTPGGATNDFTLVAAADGYQAAIGVPKDDRLRHFHAVANGPDIEAFLCTAVPVGDSDRTSATTYTLATGNWYEVSSVTHYLLAVSTVPKRLPVNDGGYTEVDEPFAADDLAKGLPVTLRRLVARLDISNPSETGFIVQMISYSSPSAIKLFPPHTYMYRSDPPQTSVIENAEYIAGAFYLYPPNETSVDKKITISGTLNGIQESVIVNTALKNGTRYIVRLRNDQSNVKATIEVAPWGEGGNIDAPVTGTLNTAYTFSPTITS